MRSLSLKKSIILPLIMVGAVLFLAGTFFVIHLEEVQKSDTVLQRTESMQSHIQSLLDAKAEMMEASLRFIVKDAQLIAALEKGDRQQLLTLAKPVYDRLHREHNITHFYFHDADRVNLLRVHKPEKYGDKINRLTALGAARSGKLFSGIELGPLGTFTLRSVLPVREAGKLLGYLELGQEIDGIIKQAQSMFKVDLFMLIDKRFLSKTAWEEGMRMLGRPFDWSLLTSWVLVSQSRPDAPIKALNSLSGSQKEASGITIGEDVDLQGQRYWASIIPILDAGRRPVARLILLRNQTAFITKTRNELLQLTGISVLLGLATLILFYYILGRTERTLRIRLALDTILSISLTPLPLKDVLSASLDAILSVSDFKLLNQGAIFVAAKDEQTLEMVAQRNLPDSLLKHCEQVPFGHCLCGKVAESREIIFTNHLNEQHECVDESAHDGIQAHSYYCVPIMLEGRLLGVLNVYVEAGYTDTASNRESLEELADTLAIVIDRKMAEQALEKLAYNDALTGLANRALFYDRMQQALAVGQRNERKFALLYLDLDLFKEINDAHGHHMGDVLLLEAANRLLGCVRSMDTVARMGGDEFTVILTEMDIPENVEFVAKNILQALAKPFELGEATPSVSISIGIAIYPTHGKDTDTLVKHADTAMYYAKKQRNTFCFFSDEIQSD